MSLPLPRGGIHRHRRRQFFSFSFLSSSSSSPLSSSSLSFHSLLLFDAASDCSLSKVISEIAEKGAAPNTAAERPR